MRIQKLLFCFAICFVMFTVGCIKQNKTESSVITEEPSQVFQNSENVHQAFWVTFDNNGLEGTSASGINPSDSFWTADVTRQYQDASAPRELTIFFNGNSVTGTYKYSTIPSGENYQRDTYGVMPYSFVVNHDTQELLSYIYYGKWETTNPITEEEAECIAQDFIKDYLEDTSYEITKDIWNESLPYVYSYRYDVVIGSEKTVSGAMISVTDDGVIKSFNSKMLSQIKQYIDENGQDYVLSQIKEFESDEVIAEIDKLVKESDSILDYEITGHYFTLGKENEPVMIYYLETELKAGGGTIVKAYVRLSEED